MAWMSSVGRNGYDVDEDGGEDDGGCKDNREKDTVRRPMYFVRLLAQLSKSQWEVVQYDATSKLSMRMAVRMMPVARTISNKTWRKDRRASSDC